MDLEEDNEHPDALLDVLISQKCNFVIIRVAETFDLQAKLTAHQ